MKHDVMPSIVQMEPEVFNSLVKEVRETVAKDIQSPKTINTSFGIVDLWNIRRKLKSARSLYRG